MRVIGVTQARIGSSRLPGKVLLEVKNKSLLAYHLKRAAQSQLVNKWIVATTHENGSDQICAIAEQEGVSGYKGDLNNVLDRFYQAVKNENADYIVRITSDCPLVDPEMIDETVAFCTTNNLIYHINQFNGTYPDGIDVEVFKFSALEEAWKNAESKSDKEHVTPYITRLAGKDDIDSEPDPDNPYGKLRITVDEASDFEVVKQLIEQLGDDKGWKIYADFLLEHPEINNINNHIFRNEGYMKTKFEDITLRKIENFSASDAYRKTIHSLIPGGAHTYSKGDDQFPERAPAAITHGKGSHIWDIDGNEYLDCAMGLTSISLGHAYQPVIDAVKKELDNGVNFQRPSYLEKEMAEKFLSLVPQHDMIKFAKNGSIVTTAAVKLARAKTGRKLVAFPSDHPFYSYDDWFIGTTDCNKGVPEEISNLSVRFKSCNIQALKDLFARYPDQIACVITEPEKPTCDATCDCGGKPGEFLKAAIELAHSNGALFIIDEMVTGFKTALPGSMTKFNLEPDMATWGKGIANGFSFCALTGKKEVMELGGITNTGQEKVFLISTTHGGETHALTAAMTSIDIFKEKNVVNHIHQTGNKVIELTQHLIQKHELADYVNVIACSWMPAFMFRDEAKNVSQGFRTLFMQEMLKRGVFFQGGFIPCLSHTEDDVFYFGKAFEESLLVYAQALKDGFEKHLVGAPAKAVFRKYL